MGLRDCLRRVRQSILDYNRFASNSNDPSIIRIELWSTRLYIVALGLAMLVLLFYSTFNVTSSQLEIRRPSLSNYFDLSRKYQNIKCPCTQISTSYADVLQLAATYNAICSSDFVSDRWIELLFDSNRTTSRYAADFRATGSQQFQVLRELCRLSIDAVEHGIQTLYNDQLISGQLLSKSVFEAGLKADILDFRRITQANFWREFTLVRSLIFGNQLMPAVQTAFTVIVRSDSPGTIRSSPGVNTNVFRLSNGSDCACTSIASCHMPAGFYDIERLDRSRGVFDQQIISPREFLAGWYTGCWPTETLLLSTSEHFYNRTALETILRYINASSSVNDLFVALNASSDSFYDPRVSIETLAENLFVETLTEQLNYTAYFEQCSPDSCFIDTNERASFLYIATSLLGLYGGLSVVLLFVTPYVVTRAARFFGLRPRALLAQVENADTPRSCRRGLVTLWHTVQQLNMFESAHRATSIDRKRQRWSTRLYLLSLAVAFLFLTLYSWITEESKIVKVKNPSLSTVQSLQAKASSLQCPCTQLSISYSDLIQLQAEYHQVCSSDFVASRWIDGLYRLASLSVENLYYADFRFASPIFQLLKSMCDLANDTVTNALVVFGQTQLVTGELLEPNLFKKQLESAIGQFKLTTPNNLLRLLQLTRNVTYMNQFLSGSYANFFVDYSIVQEYATPTTILGIYGATLVLPNGTRVSCSCANDIRCGRNAALYTGPSGRRKVIFTLPGFYSRCFPVESLLPSTLECFYSNQSCLDRMANVTNQTFFTRVTRLDASRATRFTIDTTISDLLEQLFVESWSSSLSYESYFNQCRPAFCSHTVIARKSALEIATTVAGLIGGLSVALRLLVPSLVSTYALIARRFHSAPANVVDRSAWHRAVQQTLRAKLTALNIFEKAHRAATIEAQIYLQRQSTRAYVVTILLSLFILILCTSLNSRDNHSSVKVRSLADFQRLQNLYGPTAIECPCTTLSFGRAEFYRVEPVFHQICSSAFVTTDWLDVLFDRYDNQNLSESNALTLTGTAFAHFQSLHILCDLTKQAVLDARDLFLATNVVSANMPRYELFDGLTDAASTSFRSTLANSFIHSLQMLTGMAQANGLVSGYATNWGMFLPNMTKDATIYTKARFYNACNCATSLSCVQPSMPQVPGIVVGCLPLGAFLQSTFECLYNQTCVDSLASYFNASIVPTALNTTCSRFDPQLPTKMIVEAMFIESWQWNISYERFFAQCQPKSCSYTQTERSNLLFIVTTIVGLYGGLSVLLKIVVPLVVQQTYKIVRQRRMATTQVTPVNQHF